MNESITKRRLPMIIHKFYLAQLRSLFITQHNRQTEQLTFTNKQKQENVQGLVWTSSAKMLK